MKRFLPSLSYANVVSTVCLFLLIGGGGAYAATKVLLPKNSVGTKQLKKGAVTAAKVKVGSLIAKDFKAGELPAGAPGATGPQGPAGATGSAGAPEAVPHARIRLRSHELTIGNNEAPRISFDQVVEDTAGMADLVNHPTTLQAPRSGLYLVGANLEWYNLAGEGRVGGSLEVPNPDGVGFVPDKSQSVYDYVKGGVQFLGQPFSEVIRLSAGQFVTLVAYQLTGATNTVSNVDSGTYLELTYLGP
jgi:hypothetical protein